MKIWGELIQVLPRTRNGSAALFRRFAIITSASVYDVFETVIVLMEIWRSFLLFRLLHFMAVEQLQLG
ncbi:unnamed protein product [Hydatigera taeniaeformis]|uniref:Uncharacterized protein n=1 Tax=Hydatigena taeniaeformis TaxID=6205 RepID=A0A0R3WKA0_HYDTA|nr:unnamed protein product [Hydatigera taeniaeformis]